MFLSHDTTKILCKPLFKENHGDKNFSEYDHTVKIRSLMLMNNRRQERSKKEIILDSCTKDSA